MNTKHTRISKSTLMILIIVLVVFSAVSSAQDRLLDFSEEPVRLGSGQVASIAFSPDGGILYAAHRTDSSGFFNQAQTIIYWDPHFQKQVGSLPRHLVTYMTLSPDGNILASAADNIATIRLWDVAEQDQMGVIQASNGISSLAFSPNGKILASSGFYDTMVRLWDVQTQEQIAALPLTGRGGRPLAFTPDGNMLVIGGHRAGNKDLRLWDVKTRNQIGELVGHADGIYDLDFSPDGLMLASAGGWDDKAIFLWDIRTQDKIGVLGGHSAHVGSTAFSPNGKLLASTAYWDDAIYIWDVFEQVQVGVLVGHDSTDFGWGDEVEISSDGKWLACGSENGVELWQANLPPAVPVNSAYGPLPRDDSIHDETWVILSWRAGIYANTHNIYLSDSFEDVNNATDQAYRGNQTETTLIVGVPGYSYPEGLVPGTTYYWRIDEVNNADPNSPWTGPVWSFSIPPRTAYNPEPADGSEAVEPDVVLSWGAGFDAKLHTVHLADDFGEVANATQGHLQSETTYSPGALESGKTYYWRIDEFDGIETHRGDVWSFMTSVTEAGN